MIKKDIMDVLKEAELLNKFSKVYGVYNVLEVKINDGSGEGRYNRCGIAVRFSYNFYGQELMEDGLFPSVKCLHLSIKTEKHNVVLIPGDKKGLKSLIEDVSGKLDRDIALKSCLIDDSFYENSSSSDEEEDKSLGLSNSYPNMYNLRKFRKKVPVNIVSFSSDTEGSDHGLSFEETYVTKKGALQGVFK